MRIGIVGLGLIGGSLAWDLSCLGHQIWGVSQRPETCDLALKQGIAHRAGTDLALMNQVEVVFLCTPLGVMVKTALALVPHLQPGAVLTDVGSVKAPLVAAIAPHWPGFIGGHPMAGTAEQGLQAAQSQLFRDRPYVLTPQTITPAYALATMVELVEQLQANLHQCSPEHHDRAVAWISHLPVVVSASLISACGQEPDPQVLSLARALASSGFRDTSRVGGGNPELGVMMARFNREALLSALGEYQQELDRACKLIHREDWAALAAWLQRAHEDRPPFIKD